MSRSLFLHLPMLQICKNSLIWQKVRYQQFHNWAAITKLFVAKSSILISFLGRVTICPRSLDPFYVVNLQYKMGQELSDVQYVHVVQSCIYQIRFHWYYSRFFCKVHLWEHCISLPHISICKNGHCVFVIRFFSVYNLY